MPRLFTSQRVKKCFRMYIKPMLDCPERKPLLKQAIELSAMARDTGYWPHNYFKYRLFEKGKNPRDYYNYIPGVLYDFIRMEAINDRANSEQIEDKYVFNRVMATAGVGVTEVIGLRYGPEDFRNPSGQPITKEKFYSGILEDFVVKPVKSSVAGSAVFVVEYAHNEARPYRVKNEAFDQEGMDRFIGEYLGTGWGVVLFEKRIRQHPDMMRLYPHSVNTVRIDTLRSSDGHIKLLGAFVRVGRSGVKVDNWYQGGLTIGLDVASGEMVRDGLDWSCCAYSSHPDTQVVFKGYGLPMWEEVVRTTIKAASVVNGINSVGWDVAITDKGPLMIEGNLDSGIFPIQLNNGRALLEDKDFVEIMRDYVQRANLMKKYGKYLRNFYDNAAVRS